MIATICKFLVYLGATNFVLAWISYAFVGGSAIGGRVINAQYFVDYKGIFVPVSENIFYYSLWLNRSAILTFDIGFLAGAYLMRVEQQLKQRQLEESLRSFELLIPPPVHNS